MEMCYDGALMMPSSYAVMYEDEMTYVEGGGTFSIHISARAMNIILTVGVGTAVGIVTTLLTENPYVGILAGGIAAIVCDYIFNNVWFPSEVNVSLSGWWVPNHDFSYN